MNTINSAKWLGTLAAAMLLGACYVGGDPEVDLEDPGARDLGYDVPAAVTDAEGMSVPDRPLGLAMGDLLRGELLRGELWLPEDERAAAEAVCPGERTLDGIDVSYYQGTIDWDAVRADGIRFAFIRVSDGTTFMDPQFETNWKNAKAAGVFVGTYQFFRPNQDASAQADIVVDALKRVGYSRRDLPPVIDVETTGGMSSSTVISRVNEWLQRVRSRTGRTPALYTSPGFWSSIGNPTPSPFPYLWVAHWTNYCPTLPPNWSDFQWWQYTSSGSVRGISGNVDLDLFNGSLRLMVVL